MCLFMCGYVHSSGASSSFLCSNCCYHEASTFLPLRRAHTFLAQVSQKHPHSLTTNLQSFLYTASTAESPFPSSPQNYLKPIKPENRTSEMVSSRYLAAGAALLAAVLAQDADPEFYTFAPANTTIGEPLVLKYGPDNTELVTIVLLHVSLQSF